jgi:hypothetical protein
MSLPLLEVLTRHVPGRDDLLHRQRASLPLGSDCVQTLLVDPTRSGVPASHVRLRSVTPRAQFVWVLDDDDVCADPGLLTTLDPAHDLYVFPVYVDEFDGVLPPPDDWSARCVEWSYVTASNIIVRRDLWLASRAAWAEVYDGDFDWICEALDRAQSVVWIDRVIAHVSVPGSRPPLWRP